MADVLTVIQVLFWVSLICIAGGVFLWLLAPEERDDSTETDPADEVAAGAGSAAGVLPGDASDHRSVSRVQHDLRVIHRRRQNRYQRETKH